MRCNKCRKKINSDSSFCVHCGNPVVLQSVKNSMMPVIKWRKKHKIMGAAILCAVVYFLAFKCNDWLCFLPRGVNGEYCFVHTCIIDSCVNKKAVDRNCCYIHIPSSLSIDTYIPETAKSVLSFSDVDISHNSSYTICTGTISNNGERTYSFVKIKGKFEDSFGTVLDTDWTYAVGSEGLAPSESTTFRMSIEKNQNITQCAVEIIDYDRD